MIIENFKAIKNILYLILFMIFMLFTMLFYNSYQDNKRLQELNTKIVQVELDYKFLKYNTEQLEEYKK